MLPGRLGIAAMNILPRVLATLLRWHLRMLHRNLTVGRAWAGNVSATTSRQAPHDWNLTVVLLAHNY